MRASQRGFTLLELLVAVVLLGVMMVMLTEAVRLTTRSMARQSERLDRASEIALLYNTLRAQLGDALPIAARSEARAVGFAGQADGVSFVSPSPAGLPVGLQRLAIYFVAGGATGGALHLRWQAYPEAVATASASDRILLNHVGAAVFSYYGSVGDGTAEWSEEWQGMIELPLLVRLSLVLADGRRVPDLLIALRLRSSPDEDTRKEHRF